MILVGIAVFDMKISFPSFGILSIGSSYSMYIDESVLAQRKIVTYQTGYAGKSLLNPSYDNSFFKERSSAVGRGDGPV